MAFGLGSLNPFNAISTLALTAATGGTGLLAQLAMRKVLSTLGQQILQQVGERLGLPQSVIDAAQGTFCAAVGDRAGARTNMREAIGGLSDALGLQGSQAGQFQREVGQAADQTAQDIILKLVQQGSQELRDEDGNVRTGRSAAATAKGGSWLHMIAEVMGNKLNKMANDMKGAADALDWKDPKAGAKFQADVQAFNLNFNTVMTAIKTFGEALSTAARKQ